MGMGMEPPSKKFKADTFNDDDPNRSAKAKAAAAFAPQSSSSTTAFSEELSRLDYIYVHLVAAIAYEKDHLMVKKGLDNCWENGRSSEPFQLVRTLTKKTLELMDLLTLEMEGKYWKIVATAGATAAKIFSAYSQLPGFKENFGVQITGIDSLVEKSVVYLFESCNQDVSSIVLIFRAF